MTAIDPFEERPAVVGMIHLPALPGAPGFEGSREAIRTRALEDAATLEAGGVDGLILENFGDSPFYPEDVPKHVVADMAALATAVRSAVEVPIGINVLRNDATAALSVAGAADADFVRVNVHAGAAATDQGVLEGRAHETVRLRERIAPGVAMLADVHVKHATPVGETSLEGTAVETAERGRADGVVVSGSGTGSKTALEDVDRVSAALDGLETPVFVGSGITADTVGEFVDAGADGVIVGTALKDGRETTNPVSLEAVRAVVEAARDR